MRKETCALADLRFFRLWELGRLSIFLKSGAWPMQMEGPTGPESAIPGWFGRVRDGFPPAADLQDKQEGDDDMTMFHDGNRRLQEAYGGRAVADRIVEMVESSEISEEFRDFIQSCPFFFLASSANDVTDCSFKGGAPGFVRVTDPRHLIFPDYDGNRMYKSLGNIVENPNVGLLFMNFGAEEGQGALYLRVRINGRARVHDEHEALASYPGAQRIVEVEVAHVYPNCPRYVPEMRMVAPSRHLPEAGRDQPTPEWKKIPPIAELL